MGVAWSQVKHYIKNNNKLFTLTAVKEMTYMEGLIIDSIDKGYSSSRSNGMEKMY